MRPEHLPLLTTLSLPAVHPGGEWAVVATSRPDFDADGYVGQLFRVPLDGSAPRRITRGLRDSQPRFAPGGDLIGFLRPGANDRPQVHLIPVDGGEAMCVTDQPLGVSEFAFSPDGRLLAFTARVPEAGRYGSLDGVDAAHEDARRLSSLYLQANGLGWVRDRPAQLFVLDVPDVFGEPPVTPKGRAAGDAGADEPRRGGVPAARQLTTDATDHGQPCFTADGAAVLVTAGRTRGPENLISDLSRVPVDGSGAVRLTSGSVDVSGPVVTGAGETWFAGADLGPSGLDFVAVEHGVYRLTGDRPELVWNAGTLGGDLTATHDGVLAIVEHRGLSRLVHVTGSGDTVLLDTDSGVLLTGVGVHGAEPGREGTVVAGYRDADSMGELGLVGGGAVRPLTDFGAGLRAEAPALRRTELVATSSDGYPVHGWVVRPDRDGPHPVLLLIHGGPFAQYSPVYFDEAQVYAEAGYAVVMCNPRGSSGYGRAHGVAVKDHFGDLDMADVLAFLDHAVAAVPGLDGSRAGIMGGSYGGYLTAWITAHDHRWAGAIVERGYLDPASFIGSSDIGWFFPQQYNGTKQDMDAQSPMLLTDRVRTPTLVMHSEQDLRCPLSQAMRYYTQLKLGGVETELLVFPGENHELSRAGTPWHRRQRLEAILDWWTQHLPVG